MFVQVFVFFFLCCLIRQLPCASVSNVRREQQDFDTNFKPNYNNKLDCTSEREMCLPANYSKFQLPNKGKQTIVSIGEYS
jgi:hypothetical protein